MNELRPNEQRGKTAMTLIWVMLALEAATIAASIFQLNIYYTMEEGKLISENMELAGDMAVGLAGLLYFSMNLVSIITFIRWFRRAYYNLGKLTHNTEYSDGWAAGAWFIPIMNLFVPYRIMKELYVKTKQYLVLVANLPYDNKLKTGYLPLWWTLWIIGGIIGNILFRTSFKAETLTQLIDSEILTIASSIIGIPLAIVTIIVIKDYTEAEKTLYEVDQEGLEEEKEKEYI